MKHTTPHHFRRQHSLRVLLFTAALGLAASSDVRAAATLIGTSTFNISTSDYTYSYSVTNTGPEDLVIITIPVFTPLGVSNITAPVGFSLTYDSSQMVVNFIEDNDIFTAQTFAPGSTRGTFSFNTTTAPGIGTFTAFDAVGTEFNGNVVAPAVPEPAAALTGLLACAGLLLRRRR